MLPVKVMLQKQLSHLTTEKLGEEEFTAEIDVRTLYN